MTHLGDFEGAAHLRLAGGGEFDVVRALLAEWGDSAAGIGDDAAIVAVPAGQQLVVSTDTSLEDAHFRREWLNHFEIGYRSTAAALSDLAAMAAEPLGIFVALTLTDGDRANVTRLAAGIRDAVGPHGCPILGGDVTRGSKIALTITVMGAAERPLRRSGSQTGDRVYVTGLLGGPGAALAAWERGAIPSELHRARFAHPVARLAEARHLAAAGATAGIDISDGLIADIAHLAAANDRRFDIDLEHIPCIGDVSSLEAAASGEEYELVVTGSEKLRRDFHTNFGLELTDIGAVSDGAPEVALYHHGTRIAAPASFDHFRGE
ncbi:MAG TPA: thiamine-phosphate kinase [Gemmatimonadaceae bacterium]|nr:thiamine-phosphate kinase [Gemmatimonadaceae bacterium]